MLEYPLDSLTIVRKKKQIKNELLNSSSTLKELNVAILGGSTTAEIKNILELFLLKQGFEPRFYESEYNKFYEESVFENRELALFKPDVIWVCTSNVNLSRFPSFDMSSEEIDLLLESEMKKFESIWSSLLQYDCAIIQNNFDLPYNRSLGNLDSYSDYGKTYYINRLNLEFAKNAQKISNLYISDIHYLSSYLGLSNWFNPTQWYSYKYAFSFDVIPELAKNVSNVIGAIFGKTKKCLVLDLDNTCWGGVIGDDGVQNIAIGKETAVAEAFSAFQGYAKELKERGVMLAVCSKNEEEAAKSGFEHPDTVLKYQDFIVFKANWEPKNQNIIQIAKEINIGEDSLVFIDDNPAEREIVKQYASLVETPEVGDDISEFINHVDRNGYFEPMTISKDDLKRNDFYKDNKVRQEMQSSFENYDEFLQHLEMQAEVLSFCDVYLDRITQLTNKTNQFNLTTKRYTFGEIEAMAKSEDYITLYGKLQDRFGDNGLISVLIASIKGKEAHIDLWLMSCRVLKRGMEFVMLDELIQECKSRNISKITGYYYKTKKNKMVEDLFGIFGFLKKQESEGDTIWELLVDDYKPVKYFIKVNDGQK